MRVAQMREQDKLESLDFSLSLDQRVHTLVCLELYGEL